MQTSYFNPSRRQFIKQGSILAGATALLSACGGNGPKYDFNGATNSQNFQVAILGDVHFHDIFGNYEFTGNDVSIRSMQDSVESTRMFNENYFAFKQALADIQAQGISLVVLVGDMSDDGQVATIDGLAAFLEPYKAQGMQFFITNGNHDPNAPFGKNQSKRFLNSDGSTTTVTSDENTDPSEPNTLITQKMWGLGYEGLFERLGKCGFMPQDSYLHYETPWGSTDIDKRGKQMSSLDGEASHWCHDSSYLVEPVEGLWIASVDTNVHNPITGADIDLCAEKTGENWESNAKGYEEAKTYKAELFDWLTDVTARAEQEGKCLLVFSHYPAVEYLNYSADDFYYLFDDSSYNHKRVPSDDTAQQVRATGVRLNIAGHIHISDTARHVSPNGDVLFNVQAPSLAAYIPAYKVVKFNNRDEVEITTHTLDEVADFDSLFPYYQAELEYRKAQGEDVAWEDILTATNYREMMFKHLIILNNIRTSEKWGQDIKTMYDNKLPLKAVMLAGELKALSDEELVAFVNAEDLSSDQAMLDVLTSINANLDAYGALDTVNAFLTQFSLPESELNSRNFADYCDDMLHMRSGDEDAIADIGESNVIVYAVVSEFFNRFDLDGDLTQSSGEDYLGGDPSHGSDIDALTTAALQTRLAAFARVYYHFITAQPSKHFVLDLANGTSQDLWGGNILRDYA